MKVKESKNYKAFEFLPENRSIIIPKVRTLRKSILKYGVLRPIIVALFNNKLYIADGQNLFTALELMDIPIPYIECKVNTKRELIDLIATLNSTATAWKLIDYVHSWKVFGLEDYVRIYSLLVRYNYGITEICTIVSSDTNNGKTTNKIKSGEFVIDYPDIEILKIIGYIEEIFQQLPELTRFQMSKLIRGFMRYYRFVPNYNHAYVMQKVKLHIECLRLFVEDKSFFEFFEKE